MLQLTVWQFFPAFRSPNLSSFEMAKSVFSICCFSVWFFFPLPWLLPSLSYGFLAQGREIHHQYNSGMQLKFQKKGRWILVLKLNLLLWTPSTKYILVNKRKKKVCLFILFDRFYLRPSLLTLWIFSCNFLLLETSYPLSMHLWNIFLKSTISPIHLILWTFVF